MTCLSGVVIWRWYNNEVLVYSWKNQTGEGVSFYNERHRIPSAYPSEKNIRLKEEYGDYFSVQAIERRNKDRERDLEIIRIGLKLYGRKHGEFPSNQGVENIEHGSEVYKKLKEVLYNFPMDPDPMGMNFYRYRSGGVLFRIEMDFEQLDEDGQLRYERRVYNSF